MGPRASRLQRVDETVASFAKAFEVGEAPSCTGEVAFKGDIEGLHRKSPIGAKRKGGALAPPS
ncbi:hypothetical protein NTCA1_54830 [Novosphingobium sp. TCA1]|nr:hypothetical protein NTCA1_54830 [Novosphingobium sp. TCA1]